MNLFNFFTASFQLKKQEVPTTPEGKAIAEIEKSGGSVRPLAQNDDRLEVTFSLQGAGVTDKDLVPMAQLKKVAHLNLARTSITDGAMAHVEKHTGIFKLHLEQTKITDAALARLRPLQQLEYLNLHNTAVTDAGIMHLGALKNLKNVYAWQTKVTAEGAKKLKAVLPNADINLGW